MNADRLFRVWLLLLAQASPIRGVEGQSGPPQRFTVGGRDIVRVDFANTPIGDFPAGLEMVDGIMDVVVVNGRNMLRASSRSVVRVQLPQPLPQDFTLEFEFIPKAGGNPEDLAIEGTPLINQGANSANVMWHRDYLQIVGGGATYDSKVPPSFAATLPGVLTQVVLAMQGETLKLYTNGRLMYTQSNRKFVRGRVLRVFLGGQDDGPNAVHLATLRVVDGVAAVGPVVAGGAPAGANPTGASAGAPAPSALPPSSNPVPNVGSGSGTATSTSGLTGTGTTGTVSGVPVTTSGPATAVAPASQTPTVTANSPAAASGPVSRTNPAASSSTALFAPAAPRTITLSGFSAAGIRIASPTITMPVYVAAGLVTAVAPRTVVLPNVTSAGEYSIAVSRRMGLSAYAGTGTASSASGPQPRTIVLAAVNVAGVFGTTLPRKITLPVLTASGLTTSTAPRKITLPAITATGFLGLVAPRTITLVGWTAAGTRTP